MPMTNTSPNDPGETMPSIVQGADSGVITNAITNEAPAEAPVGTSVEAPVSPIDLDRGQTPVQNPYEPIAPIQSASFPIDPEEQAALRKLEERRARDRKKRIVKIAVVCGVVAVIAGIWFVSGFMNNTSKSQGNAPEVAVVTRGDLSTSVQGSGTLKPSSYVAVTPEVSGVIQDVKVVEGQQVQTGDELLTIKNSELEKTLSDAGAALDNARRSLERAKSGVSDAWDSYSEAVDQYNSAVNAANNMIDNASSIASQAYTDAYNAAIATIPSSATEQERKTLEEEARITAQDAYDKAYEAAISADPGSFEHSGYLSAIDAANSSVESGEEALESAQRAYDYAVEQADKRVVKAPASGTVLDLKAVPGAAVGGASGGTSTVSQALMQIADLSSFEIDVEVNEVDIANVKPGQRVKVTFTAIPGLELEGTVASVASVATNSSGENGSTSTAGGVVTFKVTVKLNKPDDQLKPGMTASVTILTKDVPNALIIPLSAVIEDGNDAYVLVAKDEKATDTEMRQIVIDERAGTQVSVKSGLDEGEIVVAGASAGGETGSAASASPASGTK